jgi:acyl-CoA reductase-like NAD-dependent aldehyde dehydrogenase
MELDSPSGSETGAGGSPGAPEPAPRREGPFPTRSPLDGSPLPDVEATSPAEVASIVVRAREAQAGWAALSVRDRAARIAKVKKRLLARAEEIAALARQECG